MVFKFKFVGELSKRKIPLGTKGRTSILFSREYCSSRVASFDLSRRKLLDREWLRHDLPSRWLHPLAPLKRLSPVDLPQSNDFDKPFAASKFELCAENNPPYDYNHTEDSTVLWTPGYITSGLFFNFYLLFEKTYCLPILAANFLSSSEILIV